MDGTKIRISREKKASSLAFFPRRSIQGEAKDTKSRAQKQALARLCRDELSKVESKGTEIFRSATVRSRGYTEEVRK